VGLQVVWDAETTRMLYKLPGHKGSVNGVDFHPKEPVGTSCPPRVQRRVILPYECTV
jgi:WD40 repeat protein